jgi:hypothetical protein
MKRRLFTILSAFWLFLFAGVVVLWVWSHVEPDVPDPSDVIAGGPLLLSSDGGLRWLAFSQQTLTPAEDEDLDFLGFSLYREQIGGRAISEWRVPYWSLAVATALPLIALSLRAYREFRGLGRGFILESAPTGVQSPAKKSIGT